MGYRIDYNSETTVRRKVKMKRKPYFAVCIICVTVLLMLSLLPSFRATLRDAILPGNDEVTASALNTMAKNLEDGASVPEAVKVFCAEIIDNGEKSN